MAEQKDNALLLRAIAYSDSSLILHLLTSQHGRISLMARGARRIKSPFRAGLMPLYQLNIRWREPRTGSMGTLLEVQRLQSLLPDQLMLAGQELLAKASSLFPDGVGQGYDELFQAFNLLAGRPESSGTAAAIWSMIEASGWVGDFEHCWHCSENIDMAIPMFWLQAHLLCSTCSNQQGITLSSGCRKSIAAHMFQTNTRLQQAHIHIWNTMIHDAFKTHQMKT